MDLVNDYGSASEDSEASSEHDGDKVLSNEDEEDENQIQSRQAADDSSDSYSEDSEDSAALRVRAAQKRVRDFGGEDDTATTTATPALLPSALSAFSVVSAPPSFLDPEATRPLARSHAHGMAHLNSGDSNSLANQERHGPKGRVPAGQEFDIARLAPALKGEPRQGEKRGPVGSIIEGKAKRYRTEDGPEVSQAYSAAQIAMMGGVVAERQPTKPLPVSDFMAKGVGGALLPRRDQARKDKEQVKRMKGQSAIGSWKSEAEMVLRQQYD